MSTIPPNWLGSIIQTQGAARRTAEERDRERTAESERSSGASFADSMQNVIENSDRDGEVYSDAEGQGSQGRPSEEAEQQGEQPVADPPPQSAGGLDVEA
jgi:hypothetical protein